MKIVSCIIWFALFFMISCREDSNLMYHDSARVYMGGRDSSFTFIALNESVQVKEIFVEVCATGGPSDVDRPIKMIQVVNDHVEYVYDDDGVIIDSIVEEASKAVPGIHFLALDSPGMDERFVMKAHQVKALIPITFLRDTSLMTKEYYLTLELQENEQFSILEKGVLRRTLKISEIYIKPDPWYTHQWGNWSLSKHIFMSGTLGEEINGAWMAKNLLNSSLRATYKRLLNDALNEFNRDKENIESGLAPMREDPEDSNSPLITFPTN